MQQLIDPPLKVFKAISEELSCNEAIKILLNVYEKNKVIPPVDTWVPFGKYLPPATNQSIVIYDTIMSNSKTIYLSYNFLTIYLLDMYYYGEKTKKIAKGITHFMLLSDPNVD